MPKRSLTTSFAQSTSRAPGPDGIRNAIYKTAPQAKSDFLYPLVLKVQLNAEEPLAFKGGEAVDILNKLQLPTPPETVRSILLESGLATHHHKWVRSRLIYVTQHLIKDRYVRE